MTRFDQQMKDLAYSILHEDEREQGDAEHHIQELEKRIGVPLPTDYREFLTRYGGATFSDTFECCSRNLAISMSMRVPKFFSAFTSQKEAADRTRSTYPTTCDSTKAGFPRASSRLPGQLGAI